MPLRQGYLLLEEEALSRLEETRRPRGPANRRRAACSKGGLRADREVDRVSPPRAPGLPGARPPGAGAVARHRRAPSPRRDNPAHLAASGVNAAGGRAGEGLAMITVRLVHWKAAEAQERVERLRSAGFDAVYRPMDTLDDMKALSADTGDAVIIDLSRSALARPGARRIPQESQGVPRDAATLRWRRAGQGGPHQERPAGRRLCDLERDRSRPAFRHRQLSRGARRAALELRGVRCDAAARQAGHTRPIHSAACRRARRVRGYARIASTGRLAARAAGRPMSAGHLVRAVKGATWWSGWTACCGVWPRRAASG